MLTPTYLLNGRPASKKTLRTQEAKKKEAAGTKVLTNAGDNFFCVNFLNVSPILSLDQVFPKSQKSLRLNVRFAKENSSRRCPRFSETMPRISMSKTPLNNAFQILKYDCGVEVQSQS
ncbi:hypothetical protein VP01_467g2 [Puccinia sorghi]|uniref:Uncharacterized protein n=1 Tax=Puccinia sorghi TaxID=27349 RepID=A0A0L6UNY2_9BASI|nr:hypothetical protein VP01_467g2 [Puccinia sorghi]